MTASDAIDDNIDSTLMKERLKNFTFDQ